VAPVRGVSAFVDAHFAVIPTSIWTDKPKRNIAIAAASLKYGYTLKEIADLLSIHYTTVSKVVSSRK